MKKYFIFPIISLLNLIILIIISKIHFNFFQVDHLLNVVIIDAAIAMAIMGLCIFFVFKFYGLFEKLLIIKLLFLTNVLLGILLPVIFDRSLSFYTLNIINQYENGFAKQNVINLYRDDYLYRYSVPQIRITELKHLNLIEERGGCYYVTQKGEKLLQFGTFLTKNYLPKKRRLGEKYVDFKPDLTSPADKDFGC